MFVCDRRHAAPACPAPLSPFPLGAAIVTMTSTNDEKADVSEIDEINDEMIRIWVWSGFYSQCGGGRLMIAFGAFN